MSKKMKNPFSSNGSLDAASNPAFAGFGDHQFNGKLADKYLKKQGLTGDILKDPSWVNTSADQVAAAVLEW
jgi:hypothetical protein